MGGNQPRYYHHQPYPPHRSPYLILIIAWSSLFILVFFPWRQTAFELTSSVRRFFTNLARSEHSSRFPTQHSYLTRTLLANWQWQYYWQWLLILKISLSILLLSVSRVNLQNRTFFGTVCVCSWEGHTSRNVMCPTKSREVLGKLRNSSLQIAIGCRGWISQYLPRFWLSTDILLSSIGLVYHKVTHSWWQIPGG